MEGTHRLLVLLLWTVSHAHAHLESQCSTESAACAKSSHRSLLQVKHSALEQTAAVAIDADHSQPVNAVKEQEGQSIERNHSKGRRSQNGMAEVVNNANYENAPLLDDYNNVDSSENYAEVVVKNHFNSDDINIDKEPVEENWVNNNDLDYDNVEEVSNHGLPCNTHNNNDNYVEANNDLVTNNFENVEVLKTAPVASSSSGCNPVCKWSCSEPACEQECRPRCAGSPKCETRCQSVSLAGCDFKCDQPECSTICPKALHCPKEGCPKCETKCGRPVCKLRCPQEQKCETLCESPVCNWECKKPQMCPKPDCTLKCEDPPEECATSVHRRLPDLREGQIRVHAFRPQHSTLQLAAERHSGAPAESHKITTLSAPAETIDRGIEMIELPVAAH